MTERISPANLIWIALKVRLVTWPCVIIHVNLQTPVLNQQDVWLKCTGQFVLVPWDSKETLPLNASKHQQVRITNINNLSLNQLLNQCLMLLLMKRTNYIKN